MNEVIVTDLGSSAPAPNGREAQTMPENQGSDRSSLYTRFIRKLGHQHPTTRYPTTQDRSVPLLTFSKSVVMARKARQRVSYGAFEHIVGQVASLTIPNIYQFLIEIRIRIIPSR